jgi:hypothetical protein
MVMIRDSNNKPIDSNGNHIDEYQQNDQVQELIGLSEYQVIGIDGRGIPVFGNEDECTVVYIRLGVGGEYVEYLQRKSMFGCEVDTHVREIATRYDKWRWLQ